MGHSELQHHACTGCLALAQHGTRRVEKDFVLTAIRQHATQHIQGRDREILHLQLRLHRRAGGAKLDRRRGKPPPWKEEPRVDRIKKDANAPLHKSCDARGVDLLVEVRIEGKPEAAQHEKRRFVARVVGAVAVMQLGPRKPLGRPPDELPQLQERRARSVSR